MRLLTKRAFLFAGSCLLCGFASPGHAPGLQLSPSLRVSGKAVWRPAPEKLAAIRKKCGEGEPSKIGECFLSAMQSSGASAEAVSFAKSFGDKGYGYLREFRDAGIVSIAYVEYAFRANEMEGVYLLNGLPPMLDVDDQPAR